MYFKKEKDMNQVSKTLLLLCCSTVLACATSLYDVPKNTSVERGKKIYVEKGCVGCHGEKGMAAQDAVAPALNGQYAVYQYIQLEAFKAEGKYARRNGDSAQMVPFAKMLTDQEMWDVSLYLEKYKKEESFQKMV